MVSNKSNREFWVILFVVVFATLFVSPIIEATVDEPFILGAHRGSSISYVENTFGALKEAVIDDKYKFVEIDVQYTKDGEIVVFHDNTLSRFQKQKISIGNVTYKQLSDISRVDVPLYDDVIALIGTKKLNIEIKSQGDLEEDKKLTDNIIADSIEKGYAKQILLSSISENVVKYISSEYPEFEVGQIFLLTEPTYLPIDALAKNFYESVEGTGADYLMLHGVNLRCYDILMKYKPADVQLAFWWFDDRMYVIGDELW